MDWTQQKGWGMGLEMKIWWACNITRSNRETNIALHVTDSHIYPGFTVERKTEALSVITKYKILF